MKFRRLALTLFVALIGVSGLLSGATTQMDVKDIRPGMVGIGHTVFDGTHVEEFKANIIGVLENVIGPHRNLILAKLEGGPLASTGVIAGMSGSPVYRADRRHHADCRNDRLDGLQRRAAAGRTGQGRVSAHA
jgi:hypothetical protein